jgi:hypothetical protein
LRFARACFSSPVRNSSKRPVRPFSAPERWASPSRRALELVAASPRPGDPFAEIDELARRRRERVADDLV